MGAGRRALAIGAVVELGLTACGSPTPPHLAAGADAATSSATGSVSSTSSAGVVSGTPGAFPLTIGLDSRSICSTDDQCQIIHACDCQRCIPSKRMEVEACSEICTSDPCSGHHAFCDHGQCSTEGFAAPPSPPAGWLDEAKIIGQLVLDDPKVSHYFHEKQRPERIPLVVAWPRGIPTPAWTKFGKPVVFATEGIPPRVKPHLFVAELTIDVASANFSFGYGVEGISVYAVLGKKAGSWTIRELHVSEASVE